MSLRHAWWTREYALPYSPIICPHPPTSKVLPFLIPQIALPVPPKIKILSLHVLFMISSAQLPATAYKAIKASFN